MLKISLNKQKPSSSSSLNISQEQLFKDRILSAMEKLLLKGKLGRIPTMLDNKKMYCPYLGKGENAAALALSP